MLTRIFLLCIFLDFCLGSVQAYTILDSLDNQESCPAIARRREILNPQHKTHYNIQQNAEEEQTDGQFKPVQWLMRIIRIRGIMGDPLKDLIPKRRVEHMDIPSDLQNPNHVKRHAKMLVILEHRPE
ncbi:hypothetical protein ACLKA7_009151 [Drosophila subpalustris]